MVQQREHASSVLQDFTDTECNITFIRGKNLSDNVAKGKAPSLKQHIGMGVIVSGLCAVSKT